jgi:hypothetical protein
MNYISISDKKNDSSAQNSLPTIEAKLPSFISSLCQTFQSQESFTAEYSGSGFISAMDEDPGCPAAKAKIQLPLIVTAPNTNLDDNNNPPPRKQQRLKLVMKSASSPASSSKTSTTSTSPPSGQFGMYQPVVSQHTFEFPKDTALSLDFSPKNSEPLSSKTVSPTIEPLQLNSDITETENSHLSTLYWNKNIPESEYTRECPDFLTNISAKDQATLSRSEQGYKKLCWRDINRIISKFSSIAPVSLPLTNQPIPAESTRFEKFSRTPLSLRKYLQESNPAKALPGGMGLHIQRTMLHWADAKPSGAAPFANPSDVKVTRNTYPYAFASSVTHLVVWTKFAFDSDADGALTKDARDAIAAYVRGNFSAYFGPSNVAWWKNPATLKSVPGIEHFHVLLHDAACGELHALFSTADDRVSLYQFSRDLGWGWKGPPSAEYRKWIEDRWMESVLSSGQLFVLREAQEVVGKAVEKRRAESEMAEGEGSARRSKRVKVAGEMRNLDG